MSSLRWLVEQYANGFRCELWKRPYDGQCVAFTRTVASRAAALRDGKRVFEAAGFKRHESQLPLPAQPTEAK